MHKEMQSTSIELSLESALVKLLSGGTPENDDYVINWDAVYAEARKHAIVGLFSDVFNDPAMDTQLKEEWKKRVMAVLVNCYRMAAAETELLAALEGIPKAVLKGSSAACYYPKPERRTMGDIDLMIRPEDFERVSSILENAGYTPGKDTGREAEYTRNGICVELHRSFASLNDPEAAIWMDELLRDNLRADSARLPDEVNGLVLLEHISQHLENGLGLRQIIDWQMFVNAYLSDEKWLSFRSLSDRIGMTRLAEAVTRMCQIYLGLRTEGISWCSQAPEQLCADLMEYVLACGNFGIKIDSRKNAGVTAYIRSRHPSAFFEMLQKNGLNNWPSARKHKVLRPFAWFYQLSRYAFKAVSRKNSLREMRREIGEGRRRIEMFDRLGVKQAQKGRVVYRDGKYFVK